jgi:protein-S-isoprenylcysteine O-methyltransferase Ste14
MIAIGPTSFFFIISLIMAVSGVAHSMQNWTSKPISARGELVMCLAIAIILNPLFWSLNPPSWVMWIGVVIAAAGCIATMTKR